MLVSFLARTGDSKFFALRERIILHMLKKALTVSESFKTDLAESWDLHL